MKKSDIEQMNTEILRSDRMRRRIRVFGIVQGVGFRPFIANLAEKTGIAGSVCNKGPYVEIIAEGTEKNIREFTRRIRTDAPERAAILKLEKTPVSIPNEDGGDRESFRIIQSAKVHGEIFVSPDISTCPKCREELYDPSNRRYLHPFINCTACGPRLTILDQMPYDRIRTSMGEFPMCPDCEREYTNPEDRRYHAQPVCCPNCGPHLYMLDAKSGRRMVTGDRDAICRTREVLRRGGIAAVKGIGGFHLCCDALNEEAVARLRRLKDRPFKPFAVMMRDMKTVRRECAVDPGMEEILRNPASPILLMPKKRKPLSGASDSAPALAPSVCPDNPNVGVMLPYAPVQMLLFDYPLSEEIASDAGGGNPHFSENLLEEFPENERYKMTDCLVMTSANPRGAPICRTDEDVLRNLAGMCDVVLSHNRKIRLRADDSVMSWWRSAPYMIRRSRGYAPLPVMLSVSEERMADFSNEMSPKSSHTGGIRSGGVLGIGGELKNTFCLAQKDLLYPSAYVGDLSDMRSIEALEQSIRRMEELLEMRPEMVICDLHPGYNSSAVARKIASERHIRAMPIQHHYAHVLSCMAEHDRKDPVIGVAMDGTGYGTDGTIWGGEFLIAGLSGFHRMGHIAFFPQVGGNLAPREGWRIAASLLIQEEDYFERSQEKRRGASSGNAEALAAELGICSAQEFKMIRTMIRNGINCVESSSAGRLFDAVSAVLGFRRESTCEGEASMVLQFAAEEYARKERNPGILHPDASREHISMEAAFDNRLILQIDEEEDGFGIRAASMIRELAERRRAGEEPDRLAYLFHEWMARAIRDGCRKASETTGLRTVALSGGVMQNVLLLDQTVRLLEQDGFEVLTHRVIPPNDGGLATGQAYYGLYHM